MNVVTNLRDIAVTHELGVDYHHLAETKKLAASHVSVLPGQKVPRHTHLDEEQVYYCLHGRAELELAGEIHAIEPDTFVLIPIGTEHEVRNTGSEPFEYVYFVAFVPPHG
jgi:mannose-6-phosphate isomerase-like protein (cupin superfamily)